MSSDDSVEPPPAPLARLADMLARTIVPHVVLEVEGDDPSVVDLRFVEVNDAAAALLGATAGSLVGTPAVPVLAAADAPALGHLADAARTGGPLLLHDQRLEVLGPDSRSGLYDVWGVGAHGRVSLVWWPSPPHEGTVLPGSTFRAVAEASGDVLVLASEDAVQWASPSLRAALGRTPDEWVGEPFERLVHPEDVDRLRRVHKQVLPGRSERIRLRMSDALGAYHWVDVVLDRLADGDAVVASLRVVDAEVAALAALRTVDEQYRLVTQWVADAIVCTDAEGRLSYTSAAVRDLLGYEPGELLGTEVLSLVHPDDRAAVQRRRAEAFLEGDGPVELRARVRRSDGEYRWIESVARPLTGADGAMIGSIATWRDVHARVVADRAARIREQQFRLLAENSTDVVLFTRPDRRIAWVSPGIRALGWTEDELLDLPFTVFCRPEWVASTEAVRHEVYAGHEVDEPPDGWLFEMRAKDGSWHWLSGHIRPVRGVDGAVLGVVSGLRDVTPLVREKQFSRAVIDAMVDPFLLLSCVRDQRGTVVDFSVTEANAAACEAAGRDLDRYRSSSALVVHPGLRRSGYFDALIRVAETGEPLIVDGEREAFGDDPTRLVDLRATRVDDAVAVTWRDVTERVLAARRLAEAEERFRQLAENVADAVTLSRGGTVAWASASISDALGWTRDECIGVPVMLRVHPDDVALRTQVRTEILHGRTAVSRLRMLHKDGRYRWMEARSRLVREGTDEIVVTWRLIDDDVAREARLEELARRDALTQLPNRQHAYDTLEGLLHGRSRTGGRVAVAFCDIDDLKAINDRLGHSAGDEALRRFARVATEELRANDLVARLGGDEFLLVLSGVHDLVEAGRLTTRVRAALGEPFRAGDADLTISVSMGVTLVRPGEDVGVAVTRADRAMYRAKRAGGGLVLD